MAHVFERLLLATEHTDFDTGAEALALSLARRCGLPLAAVLPVVSNPEFEAVAPQIAAKADAQASAKREHLQALAKTQGVKLDVRVRRGPEPFVEIVEEARERAADLIVIRRLGQRGLLARALVGEMVSRVVAHSPCNVLIAPQGARMWSSRVLVGSDPLAPDPAALARAAAVASECNLPLLVLCVAASDGMRAAAAQALSVALAQVRPLCAAVEGELRTGRPHQALIAAAAARTADLIVIASHGRDGLGHAWIGGVAQKVIGLADCPVLVCPPSTAE